VPRPVDPRYPVRPRSSPKRRQWLVVLGTLGGATIGVLGTLLATVLRDYTPSSKRRWDDELMRACSGLLSTAQRAATLAWKLSPDRVGTADALTGEEREVALATVRDLQAEATLHQYEIALLAPPELQEPARLVTRHLYAVVEVDVDRRPDPRPTEFSDPPRLRWRQELNKLLVEARKALRVRNAADVYLLPD
jgi:hypothetical protein